MAQINVTNLTFCYDGSYDNVFENVSFQIDTDWKLGFIGRNGKGKTTFLRLLSGACEYNGSITAPVLFEYFPFAVASRQMQLCISELLPELFPDCEEWKVLCELNKLEISAEVLYRPFELLSHGERTKVMLAILFSRENYFLLIDEPTNHLDREARAVLKKYLNSKTGFILVSHDRALLDACVDHVLILNRNTIEVERGNFSSWYENKTRRDHFELQQNEKLKGEIGKLKTAAKRSALWSAKNEATKIGFDPAAEHDRSIATRAYIGAKTKKMQNRVKAMENRIDSKITEKEKLLKDLETPADLKLIPMTHHKSTYIRAVDFSMSYDRQRWLLKSFHFELRAGERVALQGRNGCGKSSFLRRILSDENIVLVNGAAPDTGGLVTSGGFEAASGLRISFVNQDTSFLRGSLSEYIRGQALEESLFKAVLRQLDFERAQYSKSMENYSEGQKKKVLIASSLLSRAHLYIWDEPLNYIDVFSRMQIEKLLLQYQPTLLFIEHDERFTEKIATRIVDWEPMN